MDIIFNAEEHKYTVNGNTADSSVTQLLHEEGLAPDYSFIDPETLRQAADRGTAIHKDLENVINKEGYTPETPYGEKFAEWVKNNVESAVAEQMVAYTSEGLTICGTADLVGFLTSGEPFIADHKTTSSFNREYVSWQVSLLDYFFRHLDGLTLNGRPFNWKGAVKLYCFQYNDGDMAIRELGRIPDTEIERLLECKRTGELYVRPALAVDPELAEKVEMLEMALAEAEAKVKAIKEQAEEQRAIIMAEMERQGIKSWDSGKVKITYVLPSERLGVDSTKLKKAYPQVWAECQKITKVKAGLRITIRGNEDDNF